MALILDDLLQGRLKILFISPEKLTSAAFRRLLRPKYNVESKKYQRQLPPVSLLCLDEAHCLSQVCDEILLFSLLVLFFT
jgi:ATP-dependent DNA helicase Q4